MLITESRLIMRIKTAWPFAVLLGVLLVTFWPILFGGYTLYPTDITNELFLPFAAGKSGTDVQVTSIVDYARGYYQMRWFQATAFRSGQLNLWNPYVYGGHPAFASAGSVVSLDPFNVLLLLPDLGTALAWRTFLQIVACTIFMYLYLRYLRLGTAASLVGSLGYSLNSMFWVNIFDWSLGGMLWLPLVCLLLDRAVSRRSSSGAVLAGLVLGVGLLASPLQIYFYLCITIVALFGLQWLILRHDRQSLRVYLGLGLVTLTVGIALTAVQLLPTLELLRQSSRLEGGAFAASDKHLRTPLQMVLATGALSSFVFPNLAGRIKDSMMISGVLWAGETHWQGFIGIVPFILATVGALASQDRRRIPFVVLAVLVIIVVLYTPLMLLVYERFFLVYIFCASVLAAMGCHAVCEGKLELRRAHLALRMVGLFLGVVAVGIVIVNMLFLLAGQYLTAQLEAMMQARLAGNYLGSGHPALYLQKAHNFLSDLHLTSPHTALPLLIAGLGLAATVWMITGRLKRTSFAVAVVALTAFDMGFMTVSHVPLIDLQKHPFSPTAQAIDVIHSDSGLYRVVSFSAPAEQPVLPRGTVSVYGIQSVEGRDNLGPPGLNRLVSFEVTQDLQEIRVVPIGTDLANVKYLITGPQTELPIQRFELLYDREVRVYRDRDVLPRAFWVGAYEVIPEWRAAVTRITSPDFDPRTTVVLERPPQALSLGTQSEAVKVEILDYQPAEVEIRAEAPTPGLLVLSDTYYPGWQATVDGRAVPILRANGVMRAVFVDAGEHWVRFAYEPSTFRVGLLISISAIVSAAILVVIGFLRRV